MLVIKCALFEMAEGKQSDFTATILFLVLVSCTLELSRFKLRAWAHLRAPFQESQKVNSLFEHIS